MGKPVAERILDDVARRLRETRVTPGLAVLLIGHDRASHLYVSIKEAAAKRVGVTLEKFLLSGDTPVEHIFEVLKDLNKRKDIHGIIVQLPLPKGFPTDQIIAHLDPAKDTDGFHEKTLERFLAGEKNACPVFPQAVLELVGATKVSLEGKRGIVLANSDLLGKVMAKALEYAGLSSSYFISSDRAQWEEVATEADVVVTACGIPGLLRGEMIKPGAIVIDGGITEKGHGKVVGDVDRSSVESRAAFLSPVPGGVGPVTVACLLDRVTDIAVAKNA